MSACQTLILRSPWLACRQGRPLLAPARTCANNGCRVGVQSRRLLSTYTSTPSPLRRTSPVALAMGPRQKRLEATQRIVAQETEGEKEKSDLVVVLDMDECLIHSKFLDPESSKYAFQLINKQNGQQQSEEANGSRPIESFQIMLPGGDMVHVSQRPHLHEFLQKVSSRFETHIFTAALPVYAQPVLDQLDPLGTMFQHRWFREDCLLNNQGRYVKDLSVLGKDQRRVVLVDNNPMSFLANPSNGILVSSFYSDPQDTSLLAVMALLEELDGQSDVRPYLDQKFGLKATLRELE